MGEKIDLADKNLFFFFLSRKQKIGQMGTIMEMRGELGLFKY